VGDDSSESETVGSDRGCEESESVARALAHGIGVGHWVLVSDCDVLENESHAATVLRRQRGA
jgi:hypothetical protein